jgi:hypothetical protein
LTVIVVGVPADADAAFFNEPAMTVKAPAIK